MLLRKLMKGEDDRLRAGAQSTEFGYIDDGGVRGCGGMYSRVAGEQRKREQVPWPVMEDIQGCDNRRSTKRSAVTWSGSAIAADLVLPPLPFSLHH